MSVDYLLEAVRTHLRATLTFPGGEDRAPNYVDIQPEGRPPKFIGDYYFGIDGDSVTSGEKTHLKENFQIEVTISKNVASYSADRLGNAYIEQRKSMRALERSVIVAIHGSQTLRALANTLAGTPAALNGDIFQQPLWLQSTSRTQFKASDWAGDGSAVDRLVFMVRVLKFAGAVRVQALDVMH